MSRWWNEAIGALADHVGGVAMLAFLSLIGTVLIALAWYFWPSWLPWRWAWYSGPTGSDGQQRTRQPIRLRGLRWRFRLRWRRKRAKNDQIAAADLPDDQLPDLPAEVMHLTADQLAAAGRYAEAVRERLRAIVRDLIERGVIPIIPGWTVTELAASASRVVPALAPPLGSASAIFSEIWYGMRPALAQDDLALRAASQHVQALVRVPVGANGGTA